MYVYEIYVDDEYIFWTDDEQKAIRFCENSQDAEYIGVVREMEEGM